MYQTSEEYKNANLQSDRQFESRITIGDRVLTNEEVVSINLQQAIQQEATFTIGNTISSALNLSFLHNDIYVSDRDVVNIELGLLVDNDYEYISLGVYNIDSCSSNDTTTMIMAYDNMVKFDIAYEENSQNPTVYSVINRLSELTGVEFDGTLSNYADYNLTALSGYTCREVLGFIAGVLGCNAIIDRQGKFKFVDISKTPSLTITNENYYDYSRQSKLYKVSKIINVLDNSVIEIGTVNDDTVCLNMMNPLVSEEILQDLYNKLNNLEFLPYQLSWNGDLSLDLGDSIEIIDNKGVSFIQPILSQSFTYTGGLSSIVQAQGDTKLANSYITKTKEEAELDRTQEEVKEITQRVETTETLAITNFNNLLVNSNIKNSVSGWRLTNLVEDISLYKGITSAQIPNRNSIIIGDLKDLTVQTRYMDSTKFEVTAGEKISMSLHAMKTSYVDYLRVYMLYTDNTSPIEDDNSFLSGYQWIELDSASWKKYTLTTTVPTGATRGFIRIRYVSKAKPTTTDNNRVALASIMVNRGETYPTWTSNTDDNYSYQLTRLKEAEQKITPEAITNTVKESFYTKKETEDAITDKGYQTESQVQQTVDKLELKFQNSGGYNLLYNGNFKRDIEKWSLSSGFSYIIGSGTWGSPDRCGVRLTGKSGLDGYLTQTITDSNAINGYKYTLSGNVYISSSGTNDSTGANFQLYCRITYSDETMEYFKADIDKTLYNKWQKVSVTFNRNTSKTVKNINATLSVHKTTKYLYASQLMLETGEMTSAWSPNPNEVFDGITSIDKDGITVTSSNVKSKTTMSANGFKITKTSNNQDVFKVDSNGDLVLAGDITSGATITGGTLKSSNGDMYFNMNNGYMLLYNGGAKIGQTQKNNITGTSIYGVSNGAEYGSYSCLAAKTSTDATTYTMMVTASGMDLAPTIKKGVSICYTTYFNNWNIENAGIINNPTAIKWDNTNSKESRIYTTGNNLYLRCANSDTEMVTITCNHADAGHKRIADFKYNNTDKTGIHFWRILDMHKYNITNTGTVTASLIEADEIEMVAPFSMFNEEGEQIKYSATKSLIANTEYFGTGEIINGECVIDLPKGILIGEKGYMVTLTPIGKKDIWLESKDYESFTVKGDDCVFDYLIKAHSPSIAIYKNIEGEEAPTEDVPEDVVEGKEILLES